MRTAVDARTREELDRIPGSSKQREASPGRQAHLDEAFYRPLDPHGRFRRPARRKLLPAPAFGYHGYDPAFAAELDKLGDRLEAYKVQAARGLQPKQSRLDMMRRLSELRGRREDLKALGMNIYLGNILSGVPTHAIALFSDFSMA